MIFFLCNHQLLLLTPAVRLLYLLQLKSRKGCRLGKRPFLRRRFCAKNSLTVLVLHRRRRIISLLLGRSFIKRERIVGNGKKNGNRGKGGAGDDGKSAPRYFTLSIPSFVSAQARKRSLRRRAEYILYMHTLFCNTNEINIQIYSITTRKEKWRGDL